MRNLYKTDEIKTFIKNIKDKNLEQMKKTITTNFCDGMDSSFVNLSLKTPNFFLKRDEQNLFMELIKNNKGFQDYDERSICIQIAARYGRYDFLEIIAESNLEMGLKGKIPLLDFPISEAENSTLASHEDICKTLKILNKYGFSKPNRNIIRR